MLTSCATRLLNALATFRGNSAENALVSAVLIEAQRWMRAREGKIPRLVSLRDIERCIEAFLWFEASWSLLSPLMDTAEKAERASVSSIASPQFCGTNGYELNGS